jgi:polysaccharide export outer membrane protein
MKFAPFMAMAAPLLLVGACSEDRFVGRPGLSLVQQHDLPEPQATDLVEAPRPQVLGPFDQVSIDVFGLPEFSRTVTIDRTGTISLPLAGPIEASGKTPVQLGTLITERLQNNHVREPRVSVNVTQVVSQVFTVGGEVGAPGLYPITGRMTLLRAIARAQGFSATARENYVLVYRTVSGQQYAGLYDVRAIRLGMYPDPEIFANDVIEVDESSARRTFNLVIASSGLIAAPVVALINR